jgi:hypothetical protein
MVRKIKWTIRALNDLHDAVSNLLCFPIIGHKIPELPYLLYRENRSS